MFVHNKFADPAPSMIESIRRQQAGESITYNIDFEEDARHTKNNFLNALKPNYSPANKKLIEKKYLWKESAMKRGGLIVVAGEPKIGKSEFAIQMGVSAATGGEWLGGKFYTPVITKNPIAPRVDESTGEMLSHYGKWDWENGEWIRGHYEGQEFTPSENTVLWLNGEMDHAESSDRVKAYTQGREELPFYMYCRDSWDGVFDINSKLGFVRLVKVLEGVRPDICILDTANIWSSHDELAMDGFKKFYASLRDAAKEAGIPDLTYVIVHHLKKGDGKREPGFDDVRGAGIRGLYDTGIMLYHERKPSGEETGSILVKFECRHARAPMTRWLERGDSGLVDMGEHKQAELVIDIEVPTRKNKPKKPSQPERAVLVELSTLKTFDDHDLSKAIDRAVTVSKYREGMAEKLFVKGLLVESGEVMQLSEFALNSLTD